MNSKTNPKEVRCPNCNRKACNASGEGLLEVVCSKCGLEYTANVTPTAVSYEQRPAKMFTKKRRKNAI